MGSLQVWIVMRVAGVLAVGLVGFSAFNLIRLHRVQSVDIWTALAGAILFLLSDSATYGSASDNGILYRRYFRKQNLPWEHVKEIEWSAPTDFYVSLKSGRFLRRELEFHEEWNPKEYWAMWKGQSQGEPAFVRWFWVTKPVGADGIVVERISPVSLISKDHSLLAMILFALLFVALALSH